MIGNQRIFPPSMLIFMKSNLLSLKIVDQVSHFIHQISIVSPLASVHNRLVMLSSSFPPKLAILWMPSRFPRATLQGNTLSNAIESNIPKEVLIGNNIGLKTIALSAFLGGVHNLRTNPRTYITVNRLRVQEAR